MSHNLFKHEFMFKEIVINSLKHHYMSHCPKVVLQPTADWNEMWKVHNAIEQGTERLSMSGTNEENTELLKSHPNIQFKFSVTPVCCLLHSVSMNCLQCLPSLSLCSCWSFNCFPSEDWRIWLLTSMTVAPASIATTEVRFS